MRRDLKDRKDESGHYISTEEPSMLKSQILCLNLKETQKKRVIFQGFNFTGLHPESSQKTKTKTKHITAIKKTSLRISALLKYVVEMI